MPTQPNPSVPTGTVNPPARTSPNTQTSPHVPYQYKGHIQTRWHPQAQLSFDPATPDEQPAEPVTIYSKPIVLLRDGSEVVMLEIDFLHDGAITGVSLTGKRNLSPEELLYYSNFDAVTEACKNSELDNEEGDCIHTVYFNGALAGELYSKDLSETDAKDSYSVYLSTLAISLEQPRTMNLPNGQIMHITPTTWNALTAGLLTTLDTDTFVNLYLRIIQHIHNDIFLSNMEYTWFNSKGRVNVWGGRESAPFAMLSNEINSFKRRLLSYTNQEYVSRITLRYFDAILSVVSSDPAYQNAENDDWKFINIKAQNNTTFELEFTKITSPVELLDIMKAYDKHLSVSGGMGNTPYEINENYMLISKHVDKQLQELAETNPQNSHTTLGYNVEMIHSFASFCAVLVSLTQLAPFYRNKVYL